MLLFLLLGLSTAAWSYAGNVFILQTEYVAAGGVSGIVGVYAGDKPDQTGAGSRPLTAGDTAANYKINPLSVTPTAPWNPSGLRYINIIIYDSPNNPAWILMAKTGGPSGLYSTIRADLGDTVPTDTPVNSITWYYKGTAAIPGTLAVNAGYEVAKATWVLDTNYDYDSVDAQLTSSAGTVIDEINDAGAHFAITNILGRAQQYKTGQLIDGRVLNVGTPYIIKVRGNVAGPFDSDWATRSFTTNLAAGGGPVTKTWTFYKPATGINTFAVPFTPATARDSGGTARDITTVGRAIKEINRQAGAQRVKVFGWFDNSTQIHKGLTSITYTGGAPDADVNATTSTATGGTPTIILTTRINTDEAYQVSVNGGPIGFTLTGSR